MRFLKCASLALAVLCLSVGYSATASAQATRTWVSGVGDDANPCSRTAPCKTFAGAISKTAASGEISVLDPGGFGAVTITKSISIVADGNEGGILASGVAGITINAGTSDVVSISGLIIEGAGTGTNGIRILQAGSVYVTNTTIRGFKAGTAPAGRGISVETASAVTRLFLNNVQINNNVGLYGHLGVGGNGVFINKSVIEANLANSLYLDTATTGVVLHDSTLAGSPVFLSNGASLISTGTNFIAGAVGPTSNTPLR